MDAKDWKTKVRMEQELQVNPGYGSRRLSKALSISRQQAQRVMKKFGLRPYRRRGRKRKTARPKRKFPNLLMSIMPLYPNHVWATDFTELVYKGRKIYVSTILDLFTRRIIGLHVTVRKGSHLTIQTLANALFHRPPPTVFHSDNGKEYEAKAFIAVLEEWNINISRSRPGCPWENGYQESFYDKFKVDFWDPSRFKTLGELVAEIYRAIWAYNHTRIHSALNMPPGLCREGCGITKTTVLTVESLSEEISP